jgi:hypothetical protein
MRWSAILYIWHDRFIKNQEQLIYHRVVEPQATEGLYSILATYLRTAL